MKVLQQNHFSFMNQSHNKTALLLWILLTILLVFPLLLSQFPQISGEKLYGIGHIDRHDLSLSWKNISTGKFQDDADRLIRQEIGLSNYWVRLHNEINFKAFRYSNTEKLVLGKNDCFFEEIYITHSNTDGIAILFIDRLLQILYALLLLYNPVSLSVLASFFSLSLYFISFSSPSFSFLLKT